MILKFKDNSRRTVSYPKWLVENHIGKRLKNNETVDHQDRDFQNDNINNLKILTRSNHGYKDALRVKNIEITCVWCGNKSIKRAADLDHNAKMGKVGPFCSKQCTGKYGKSVQMGEKIKFPDREKTKREYYKL